MGELLFYLNQTSMAHTCQAAVVHCIDFRFQQAISEYLKGVGVTSYDRISLAGAVKSISSPENESEKEFLLKQIGISVRLHEIKEVILINHEDCGAYGGKKAFASDAVEKALHVTEMNAVRDLLKTTYPTLVLKLVYAHINDEGEISFEEIAA